MHNTRLALFAGLMIMAFNHAYADPPIVINNNNSNASAPPANSGCNNSAPSGHNPNDLRPGTYYKADPNGGTDTVYTTGDKTPYMIDNNNCNNNQPIVQPYIYGTQPVPPRPRGR